MSQSSSPISKKCKIVSGDSRQSLMSQFMVCTHQHKHSHPETDANLLTQQPESVRDALTWYSQWLSMWRVDREGLLRSLISRTAWKIMWRLRSWRSCVQHDRSCGCRLWDTHLLDWFQQQISEGKREDKRTALIHINNLTTSLFSFLWILWCDCSRWCIQYTSGFKQSTSRFQRPESPSRR